MLTYIKDKWLHKPSMTGLLKTLVIFLLFNAGWWVIGQWSFIFRPAINIDYIFVIMATALWWPLGLFSLLIIYALETLISSASLFFFSSPQDFLQTIQYADNLNLAAFLSWDIAFKWLILGVFGVVALLFSRKAINIYILLFIAIVIILIDAANGSSYFLKSKSQFYQGNIAGSSIAKTLASFKEAKKGTQPLSDIKEKEKIINKQWLVAYSLSNENGRLMIIILESFGLSDVAAINDWHQNTLYNDDITEYYDFEPHMNRFRGATTAAEVQHLCFKRGDYTSNFKGKAGEDCLPAMLSEKDVHTAAYHGFSKGMFRRDAWWKDIGFTETLFASDFIDKGAPQCGSGLKGVCDDYILNYMFDEAAEKAGFYYFLTLNTHVPVINTAIPDELQVICNAHSMSHESCLLEAHINKLLQDISTKLNEASVKPFIMIIGDHAPPFGTTTGNFYSRTHTPAFILRPKAEIAAE